MAAMSHPSLGPAHTDGHTLAGLPLSGPITSFFGSRDIAEHAGGHTGVDIGVPEGRPVLAPAPGIVSVATADATFGAHVVLTHMGGWHSLYAHLSRLEVAPGQAILRGDCLGLSGSTGLSTGPHLHWGLAFGGSPLLAGPHLRDPLDFIAATPGEVDIERILRAAAHTIYGALQAAGTALGTSTEEDFAIFPPGSPEQALLEVQRAANPLIARFISGG